MPIPGIRASRHRDAVFVFEPFRSPGYVYIQVFPPGSRRYPVYLATAEGFLAHEQNFFWHAGLFFGALATIFIYNLAIYFGLREKTNLYYALYLLLFIGLFLTLERVPESFYGHTGSKPYLFLRSAIFPAMLIFFSLFNREFLGEGASRYQSLVWRSLIVGDIGAIFANFFVDYRIMMPVNLILTVIHSSVALLFVIRAAAGGFKPAQIMFIGWIFFLLSAILSALHILGKFHVAYNDYVTHFMKYGAVAENFLFTLAIGARVRFYKSQSQLFGTQLAFERENLARDLHDVLGSEFGEMQMRLSRPDVPADIAHWLGGKARHISARIRDAVFILQSDLTHQKILYELSAYVQFLSSIEGLRIEAHLTERIEPAKAFLLLDVLRILQEWSGNCMKHGQPAHLRIYLDSISNRLRLTVVSDGKAFSWSGQAADSGQGLRGIRQRVRQRFGFSRCRVSAAGKNIFVAVLRVSP